MPATTTSPSFTVSWSGSDGPGSGIARYSVFVSADGGPFEPFVSATTATSATFHGQTGHTYAFFSVATSNVGLVQSTPTGAQATIAVVAAAPPPTPAPLVTVTAVNEVWGKHHRLARIVVDFSGPLNAAEAGQSGLYALTRAGKKGSFAARGAKRVALASVAYDAARDSVTLALRKPIALKKPLQLRIDGTPPSGLHDSRGRFIDGAHHEQPGSDAVVLIGRRGAVISQVVESPVVTGRRHQRAAAFAGRPFHRIARGPWRFGR